MALSTKVDTPLQVIRTSGDVFRATIRHIRVVRLPIVPTSIVLVLSLLAIFAPWLAPHEPTKGSLLNSLIPPFWMDGGSMEFPLGTDFQGRDIFSRAIYGSRISLLVAGITIVIGGAVGTFLGVLSGYYGRWADTAVMRLADLFFSLPPILLALVFAMNLGASLRNVIIIIVILLWARFARQVRAEVLSVRERDFVALARVTGASGFRIMIRHILPNISSTPIVIATLDVGAVILLESSLSFLGVGVPPPAPTWGLMISDGRKYIADAWWITVVPGIAMLITILAFNLLGDWLRDFLDPKLRQL